MRKLFHVVAIGLAAAPPALSQGHIDCDQTFGPDIRLVGCHLDLTEFSGNLIGADLTLARLRSVNFSEARLNDVVMRYAVISDADLDGIRLEGADLTGADFSRSSLVGADLRGANLMSAVLVDADLTEADLTGAIVYEADLTGAALTGAKLEGVIRDAPGPRNTELQTAAPRSSGDDGQQTDKPTDAVTIDVHLARHVQELLKTDGHYPGPIDGDFGPVTRAGLRAFQKESGLVVTGVLDHETLRALQQRK